MKAIKSCCKCAYICPLVFVDAFSQSAENPRDIVELSRMRELPASVPAGFVVHGALRWWSVG